MRDKIRNYVSEQMRRAPKGLKVQELIDEITEELLERYNTIVREGYAEDEAYQAVIEELGDTRSIVRSLRNDDIIDNHRLQRQRRFAALLLAVGVGFYVLAAAVFLIQFALMNSGLVPALIPLICLVGAGTCILIYSAASGAKYVRTDDTLVEDFKEFRSFNMQKERIRKSVTAMIWSLTLAAFFVLSVIFNAWGYTWIIFLIGGAISRVVNLAFDLRD
ncbi:MAG TPA: hypothetical protein DEQ02_04315 [Ruminococcaceae bacterium]|nr:hypothetical protein [Oscillospiraceae bacterium]